MGIDSVGGDESEDCDGSDDVHEGDERTGAKDGAWEGSSGVADFFAHGGDEFEAGEGKGDLRPEVDGVPIPGGHHVGGGEVGGGTVAEADYGGDADEDYKWDVGADAAGVLEPLTDIEADDVEDYGDYEERERDC